MNRSEDAKMMHANLRHFETLKHIFAGLALQYPGLALVVAFRPKKMPAPEWEAVSDDPFDGTFAEYYLEDDSIGPTLIQLEGDIAGKRDVAYPSWNFHGVRTDNAMFELGFWGYWLQRQLQSEEFKEGDRIEYIRCLQVYSPVLFQAGQLLDEIASTVGISEAVFDLGGRSSATVDFAGQATFWLSALVLSATMQVLHTDTTYGEQLKIGLIEDIGLASTALVGWISQQFEEAIAFVPKDAESVEVRLAGELALLELYRLLSSRRTMVTHAEIAKHLGVQEDTVAQYLRRLTKNQIRLVRRNKTVALDRS